MVLSSTFDITILLIFKAISGYEALSYHMKSAFTRGCTKGVWHSWCKVHHRCQTPLVHSLFSDISGRAIIIFKQLWRDGYES